MSRIAALDKYITDDIRRHGNRLGDLEKKITNVYQEFAAAEAIDDDALFANEDDEEEESAFVMYALRHSSVGRHTNIMVCAQGAIHGRYWRGFLGPARTWYCFRVGPFLSFNTQASPQRQEERKRSQRSVWFFALLLSLFLTRLYCHSAKSAEPPPPYPPPQTFSPLTAETVKNHIGLLRGYFEHRLAGLDTLLDDQLNPTQTKLGPLGQVIRPSSGATTGGGSKKKAKPKDGAAALAPGLVAGPATGAVMAGTTLGGASVGVMSGVVAGVIQPATPVLSSAGLLSPLGGSASVVSSATAMVTTAIPTGSPQPQTQTPKKKKAAAGVGSGAGGGAGGTGGGPSGGGGGTGTGKKRGRPPEGLPPVVVASA